MNPLIQIFRSIPIAAIGMYLLYEATKEPDNDFIFDGIWMLAKAVFGLIILFWTFNNNRKVFNETRSKLSFLPIVAGIGCSIIFYFTHSKENPSILFAGFDGGFNGASIDLRADGTYQVSNNSGIGSNYFYGQYQIKDSLITLDKSNIDKIIVSDKLVMRSDLDAFLSERDTLLYQVDEKGNTKRGAIVFTVHIYKKKN